MVLTKRSYWAIRSSLDIGAGDQRVATYNTTKATTGMTTTAKKKSLGLRIPESFICACTFSVV